MRVVYVCSPKKQSIYLSNYGTRPGPFSGANKTLPDTGIEPDTSCSADALAATRLPRQLTKSIIMMFLRTLNSTLKSLSSLVLIHLRGSIHLTVYNVLSCWEHINNSVNLRGTIKWRLLHTYLPKRHTSLWFMVNWLCYYSLDLLNVVFH